MQLNKIYQEPCLDTLKRMPNNYLDCVITSPPYWQLRDYGYPEQWGLEPTFNEYLEHLWEMMNEIHRVLKTSGTVWINLGDTYNGNKTGNSDPKLNDTIHISQVKKETQKAPNKSLLLLPHRFAIGCIDRGWIVRNDIIWAKRNGMPESVTDRFSKKHEYFFFMVKSEKYFFDLDAIRDKHNAASLERYKYEFSGNKLDADRDKIGTPSGIFENKKGKNPGSVSDFWDIPTKPSSNEHYAAYNDELLKKPILSGCPEFVCNKCGKPREKIFEFEELIVSEKDFSEKYKDSGVNSAGGRSTYITEKLKNSPNKIKIAEYLKVNKGKYTSQMIDAIFGYKDTAAHWFRTDTGFSFPNPIDWLKLKEILGFDNTYDTIMTETVKVIVDDKGFKGKVKGLTDCGCNAGFKAGIVYDPFMGTGSTAEISLRTNRNYIGSEMSIEYCKIAEQRLNPYKQQISLF
jgi:site-specific DNA-methyltransferase (adenine-specific)